MSLRSLAFAAAAALALTTAFVPAVEARLLLISALAFITIATTAGCGLPLLPEPPFGD